LYFAGVHGMDIRPPNKGQRMLLLFMLISLHQNASLFVKCFHWIFEWIHWSHWRGCSCDLVNSLVHWTTEPTFHFVIIFASHSYMEKLQNCAKDDFLNIFMGTFHDMTWESFHVNAAIIRAIQNYMRTHAASIWSACIKFLFPEQEDHPYLPDIIWKGLNFFQSRK
jgi:hypothetical protein